MFRTFAREIKPLNDESAILQKMTAYYPDIQTASPARTLEQIYVKNIESVAKRSLVEAIGVLNDVLPRIANDSVIQSVFLNVRNAIKARFPDEDPVITKAYNVMRFDQTKWKANREAYKAKIYEQNADKKQIPINKVSEVVELTKRSDNLFDLAVGLEIVCGSRIGEILSYGNFTEAKQDGYVVQTGILKQRENTPRENITKPIILVTRAEFFEMLRKLRGKVSLDIERIHGGTMTHYELSQKYNQQINNRAKSLFNDEDVTSHMLRKIYGHLSYQLFGDRERISEARWLSEILGHSPNSIEVAASYSTIGFTDTSSATEIPRNTKARDGHAYDRLLLTVAALKRNNLSVSARILKSYGYGSNTIEEYMKKAAAQPSVNV